LRDFDEVGHLTSSFFMSNAGQMRNRLATRTSLLVVR
jgi:hypothetical protein